MELSLLFAGFVTFTNVGYDTSMIPEDAKLVFKGQLFDVYQWQQEMFDGSFATFERLRRKPSVNVVPITSDGKILMCDEEQPTRGKFVCIPGGQVEGEEDFEAAAMRELKEETGYEGDFEFWMETTPYGNKVEWSVMSYVARNCKKVTDQHLDSGERISLRSVDFDTFVDIAISDPLFQNAEITLAVMDAMRKPDGLEKLRMFLFQK